MKEQAVFRFSSAQKLQNWPNLWERFCRGQMESPIVIDSSDEFELDGFYELMVHACDEEMGYLWVGDGKNEGLDQNGLSPLWKP